MNRVLAASLLNAFVFPGAGHIYLKRATRGLLFLVPSLVALFVLMQRVLDTASGIADRLADGRIPLDPTAIATEISRQGTLHGGATDFLSAVLVVCWIGSIVDGWWLARR